MFGANCEFRIPPNQFLPILIGEHNGLSVYYGKFEDGTPFRIFEGFSEVEYRLTRYALGYVLVTGDDKTTYSGLTVNFPKVRRAK